MDDKILESSVTAAEEIDSQLQEQSIRIGDIQGSLEAIIQVTAEKEPHELTDHQQAMVDEFHSLRETSKDAVHAMADSVALEGFLDVASNLTRRAVASLSKEVPKQFELTSKALKHYVELAARLRVRLRELRPLIKSRDFPYEDVFDYGTYSRFFQVNGVSIGGFQAFHDAMNVQCAATRHVMSVGVPYSAAMMEKILASLQDLHLTKSSDPEKLIHLRDTIENHWTQVWKEANISMTVSQVPQSALNAFPERKFVSLAALLDNRYLVAHQPKNNGGQNPSNITSAIKHYGASLVFDKKTDGVRQSSMNVPNIDDLLILVDQTLEILQGYKTFKSMASDSAQFAKDFAEASKILNKQISSAANSEFYGYIAEYFKFVAAMSQAMQQPYVQMAWMFIRCTMVVVALAEHAAVEEPAKRKASAKFLTKQNTEFTNPALESFRITNRALQAARCVSKT